ncbi:MAG TPA: tetratricopeptide repeat protein [Pyrinomonadaceae bacterium]|jgi:tetratricopeptide (TPR) repeat protein|nr:tetratricopeptide repeat protein [Pyrinomonadaceae bacterium]
MPQRLPKLFISYAREDKDYKNQLVEHLEGLVQQGVIESWHDGQLIAGQQWSDEIVRSLKDARIVLLLVSPSFISSDYISRVELAQAGERYERGEVTVIPVLVRNVHAWESKRLGDRTLGSFQAVPRNFKFVADWPNKDAAFAEIVAEVEKAVEALKPLPEATGSQAPIPAPPSFGFVPRAGRDGRDIIERLQEELSPQSRRLVALWGAGGVGKTTLAAEAVRTIAAATEQRVVWVTAEGLPNFTFTTLLDDIAEQFDRTDLRPLAAGPKEEAVRTLIAAAPTLLVLDDFETISPEEEARCLEFLSQRAPCPALITTRQKVEGALLLLLEKMSEGEADRFLDRLIAQTQDPDIYTESVRSRILGAAESNPLVVQWVVGQIDLAQAPDEVLSELSHGEGKAAERVFDRSFNLKQMEDGGRAVLLALSLFKPSGTRPMIAEVAGMSLSNEKGKKRFKKAQQTLASLWLIKQTPDGQRLTVAGLTRDFAKARLSRDPRAKIFRPRFVSRFVRFAEAHEQPTAADLNALEAEKDNLFGAMDVAYETKAWTSVSHIMFAIGEFLSIRGYWDEMVRRGEQAVAAARRSDNVKRVLLHSENIAVVRMNRGEYKDARPIWEQALAYHKSVGNEDEAGVSLNNLGVLANREGDYEQARLLYEESLKIRKRVGDQIRIASSLHNLGSLAHTQGGYAVARRLYEESLEMRKRLSDRQGIAFSLLRLGTLALDEGKLDEVEGYLEQSLSILTGLGDKPNIAECLETIGSLRVTQGRYPEAETLFDESSKLVEALSIPRMVGSLKYSRGLLAEKRGDVAEAARLFKEALEILERLDFPKAEKARQALARLEG